MSFDCVTALKAYKTKHITSFGGVTAINSYKTKHLTSFGGATAPQIHNAVRYGILNQQHHAHHTFH